MYTIACQHQLQSSQWHLHLGGADALKVLTCAMATPSSGLPATSHAARATPAFRLSASATAFCAPPKTSSRMLALSAASPPARSFTSHLLMPRSKGSSLCRVHQNFNSELTRCLINACR